MPELAEVHYYSRLWSPGTGEPIRRVHARPDSRVYRDSSAAAFHALASQRLTVITTHGKNLLFGFTGGLWVGGHLGMTGELLTEAPDHTPGRHDHLTLHLAAQTLVFRDPRMFGRLVIDECPGGPPPWWQALPPEILSPGFITARVSEALTRHARSPLKALLLDQSWFPGVGNWMADEVLWQLRLHPAVPAGTTDAAAVRRTVRSVTRRALGTIGVDWSDPPATWLFRHRWKAGGHCPRCATALTRGDLRGRTACWCPACQPS